MRTDRPRSFRTRRRSPNPLAFLLPQDNHASVRDSYGKRRARFQFGEVNSSTWAISGYYIRRPSIQTHGHMHASRLFPRSSGVSRGFVGQEGS